MLMNGKLTAKEEIICINSGHRKSPPPPETCPLIHIFSPSDSFLYQNLSWQWKCVHSVLSDSVVSWTVAQLWPTTLLSPWNSPCKITGVGCHLLFQGIFPTQKLNPHLLQYPASEGELFTTSTTWKAPKSLMKWSEVKSLSCVQLFATPWTVAYQASPSMAFSRQEGWSGFPFPSPKISCRCT